MYGQLANGRSEVQIEPVRRGRPRKKILACLDEAREIIRVAQRLELEKMRRAQRSREYAAHETRYTGFVCEIETTRGPQRVLVEAEYTPETSNGDGMVEKDVHLIAAFIDGRAVLRELPGEERAMLRDWAIEHFAKEGLDVEGLR